MNLPSDVTLYAFDVLKDFVSLYEYVQRDSKVRNINGICLKQILCKIKRIY